LAKKNTKKSNKPVELDLSALGEDAGLTLLQDSDYAAVLDRLPLFLPRIDRIFGGGFPFGRIIEIAGKNAGGKSTLAFHAARVATMLGCIVVLIDVEGTADRVRLTHLGIDVSKILVKQPDLANGVNLTVEEIGRTVESTLALFKKKYPHIPVIYIWDSLGQTPSEVEFSKEYGDKNVGARASAVTQLITKINPQISDTKSMFIAINQIRDDIGGNTMFATSKMPGGRLWEHALSLRVEIKKKQAIDKTVSGKKVKLGHIMGVKVNKSKVSRPHQEEDAYLISDNGIDYEYNLVRMAEEAKFVSTTGRSYEYVDSDGTIHKKEKEAFVEWLRTPEAQPVREELLNLLVAHEFPNGYTALTNANLEITGWMDTVKEAGLVTLAEIEETPQSADDIINSVQNDIDGELG
jgi:RecA/RadA recombinase